MLSPDVPEFIPRSQQVTQVTKREGNTSEPFGQRDAQQKNITTSEATGWRVKHKENTTTGAVLHGHASPSQYPLSDQSGLRKDEPEYNKSDRFKFTSDQSSFKKDDHKCVKSDSPRFTQEDQQPENATAAVSKYNLNSQSGVKKDYSKHGHRHRFTERGSVSPQNDTTAWRLRASDSSNWSVKEEAQGTSISTNLAAHDHPLDSKSLTSHKAEGEEAEKYQSKKDTPRKDRNKAKKYNFATGEVYFSSSPSINASRDETVTYKKILQRSHNDGATQKAKTSPFSISQIEQWPSLGGSQTWTSARGEKKESEMGQAQNVWSNNSSDIPQKENISSPNIWTSAKDEKKEPEIGNPQNVQSGNSTDMSFRENVSSPKNKNSWQIQGSNSSYSEYSTDACDNPHNEKGKSQKNKEKNIKVPPEKHRKSDRMNAAEKVDINLTKERTPPARQNNGQSAKKLESGSTTETPTHSNTSVKVENRVEDGIHTQPKNNGNILSLPKTNDAIANSFLKSGIDDTFEWQVQGAKKKQPKPKELHDEKAHSHRTEKKTLNRDYGKKGQELQSAMKTTASGIIVVSNKKDISDMGSFQTRDPSKRNIHERRGKVQNNREPQGARGNISHVNDKNQKNISSNSFTDKKHREGNYARKTKPGDANNTTEGKSQKPLDPEAAKKWLEAKQLKKEEKIRKRETKIKQAQQRLKSDSKVTMVTRDFLEKALSGGSQKAISSRQQVPMLSNEYPALHWTKTSSTGAVPKRRTYSSHAADHPDTTVDASKGKSAGTKMADYTVQSQHRSDVSPTKNDSSMLNQVGLVSYSSALQTVKRNRQTVPERSFVDSPQGAEALPTSTVKKKVKTKDLIEVDLMAFAEELKNRKKLKTKVPQRKFSKDLKASAKVVRRGKIRANKKKNLSKLKKAAKRLQDDRIAAFKIIFNEAKRAIERQKTQPPTSSSTPVDLLPVEEEEKEKKEGMKRDEETVRKESTLTEETSHVGETEHDDKLDSEMKGEKERKQEIGEKYSDGKKMDSLINDEVEKQEKGEKSSDEERLDSDNKGEIDEKEEKGRRLRAEKILDSGTKCDVDKKREKGEKSKAEKNLDSGNNGEIDKKEENDENSKGETRMNAERARWIIFQELKMLADPVHQRNFREYCTHVVTDEINEVAAELLKAVVLFQRRLYARDPAKGAIKQRFVCGLKQTTKLMGKMSCIIMAPNIQKCYEPGGLDDAVEKTLQQAKLQEVPVVFALSLKKLGGLTHIKQNISCVGIINYQGAQDSFHKLMALIPAAKEKYQALVRSRQQAILPLATPPPPAPPPSSLPDLTPSPSSSPSPCSTPPHITPPASSLPEPTLSPSTTLPHPYPPPSSIPSTTANSTHIIPISSTKESPN